MDKDKEIREKQAGSQRQQARFSGFQNPRGVCFA
uniref:Uncharacterized protein n=1 Tax=Rhizophora mucronata TaxID=61149 RepID=A0A2P2Q2Q0_RHIMU